MQQTSIFMQFIVKIFQEYVNSSFIFKTIIKKKKYENNNSKTIKKIFKNIMTNNTML